MQAGERREIFIIDNWQIPSGQQQHQEEEAAATQHHLHQQHAVVRQPGQGDAGGATTGGNEAKRGICVRISIRQEVICYSFRRKWVIWWFWWRNNQQRRSSLSKCLYSSSRAGHPTVLYYFTWLIKYNKQDGMFNSRDDAETIRKDWNKNKFIWKWSIGMILIVCKLCGVAGSSWRRVPIVTDEGRLREEEESHCHCCRREERSWNSIITINQVSLILDTVCS